MSLLDVTREMHRTRADHVRIVLLDFFGGGPPDGEVQTVVQLTEDLARAFRAVAEDAAPEEPQKEQEVG